MAKVIQNTDKATLEGFAHAVVSGDARSVSKNDETPAPAEASTGAKSS